MNEFNYEGWVGKIFGYYPGVEYFPPVGSDQTVYIVLEDDKATSYIYNKETGEYILFGGGGEDEGALHYKGTVASASDLPSTPANGDIYIATAAFELDGEEVDASDMLIWNEVGAEWNIIQGNITIEDLQSDWNENNPDSSAYVKNRTHYDNRNINNFTLKSVATGFFYYRECVTSGTFTHLVPGDEYTVTYKGETYNLTVASKILNNDGTEETRIYLGNLGLLNRTFNYFDLNSRKTIDEADNGLPFLVEFSDNEYDDYYSPAHFIGNEETFSITLASDAVQYDITVSTSDRGLEYNTCLYLPISKEEGDEMFGPETGEQCEVKLNGTSYTGTWTGSSSHYLAINVDASTHFNITISSSEVSLDYGIDDITVAPAIATVEVETVQGTLKQLDDKYISDNIARASDMPDVWTVIDVDYNEKKFTFKLLKNGVLQTNTSINATYLLSSNSRSVTDHIIGNLGTITSDINGQFRIAQDMDFFFKSGYWLLTINVNDTSYNKLCSFTITRGIKATSVAQNEEGFTTGDQVKTYVDQNGFNPSSMETVTDPVILNTPQADWNQADSTAPDYIKNKPTISEDIWSVTPRQTAFYGTSLNELYLYICKNGVIQTSGTFYAKVISRSDAMGNGNIRDATITLYGTWWHKCPIVDNNARSYTIQVFEDSNRTKYLCECIFTPIATEITSSSNQSVTGEQVYDYVSTQVGNIETLLASI